MPGVGVSIPRPPAGVAAPQAGVAPMPPAPYAGVAPPATIAGVASQRLRMPPGFAAAAAAGAAAEPAGGAGGARPDALVGTAPKAASIQSCQLSLLWIRGEAGQEAQLLGMQAQADKQATPQHPAQLHQVRASPETAVGAAAAATLLGGHRRRCVRPPVTCSDTANLLHSLLPLVSAPAPGARERPRTALQLAALCVAPAGVGRGLQRERVGLCSDVGP